jgi:hypothetical protein
VAAARDPVTRSGLLAVAGVASIGAGIIHAAAIGIHTEHQSLVRLFIAVAVLQIGWGVLAVVRPTRWVATTGALLGLAAATGWVVTRTWGVSWFDGLEVAEEPQLADTAAAVLAVTSAISAAVSLATDRVRVRIPLLVPALLVGLVAVPAMVSATRHVHDGGGATEHGHAPDQDHAGVDHMTGAHDEHTTEAHPNDGHHATDDPAVADTGGSADENPWPRPWDPAVGIDLSGVPGVTAEQEARARALIERTLADLPQFADVRTLEALGYRSIGDAPSGHEHYINAALINDDVWLDPNQPESLVFAVDGDRRTLVSAMFMANRPLDDPELADYAGALMEWHIHDNLCWGLGDDGLPKVKAVIANPGDRCPPGTVLAGGDVAMTHVWIAPHRCGPFAALGDPAERADQCGHAHGDEVDVVDEVTAPQPYDPTQPIDLSGMPGVTPEQQAFAENLIAVNLRYLPQWSDPATAEAAGFRSIGDGLTGHEHYIQWDWINDDIWLDPNRPESLVFEPQPDGSKKLVSAMYMLPRSTALEDVPDWGGALMQWHIHDDLCFTDDPNAPQVASVTSVGGTCPAPLVKFDPSPMIHVWITPHECGPFASLEGVGAGQVEPGETRLCDHAHGS